MNRKRIGVSAAIAVIAAAGLAVGIAVAVSGPSGKSAPAGAPAGPGYSWYRSMMGRYYGGSMMGGSSGGWMMGRAGASRAGRIITFTGASVGLAVVAGPAGGPDETFRIAGMVNPTIVVPAGSRVSIQVINADPGTAHGLVVTASIPRSSWMPMMTAVPAFAGSALWFLGNPTAAGMHTGTLTFAATRPGTYHYLCPVPGHVQKGMTGTFTVTSTG